MKKPLIVITGPTASGKTEMAIELAHKKDGEIVNADSMQIYKYMDVGTAKPTLNERRGIPHYLIDEIEPTERYSVAQYCKSAHKYIAQIHKKGKIPILVGGTGLYIDSVVHNIKYQEGGIDEQYRAQLKQLAYENGNEYLHNMLKEIDSQSAQKIHVADTKRIIRALEVYHLTGETITEQKRKSTSGFPLYDTQMFAIDMDRERLYHRINKRVDKMFGDGLVDEVLHLLDMGINESMTSMQGIGYKETVQYVKGLSTLEETKSIISQSTRRYAKRQLTWFRKNGKIVWIRR